AAAEWIDQLTSTNGDRTAAQQELSSRLSAAKVLEFPLFIYTLFGGLIVRKILRMLGHESAVDRESINRLTSTAMDILVVAAITSLNLETVASLLVPFLILFVCGAIWAGICLLVIARWILPPAYWFQLGLINYGMSTGTTATGFVLLRVVDPELESGAAEDYALAAPLSSPFIGGGIITLALPLLILERVSIAFPALMISAIVAILIVIGAIWNSSAQRGSSADPHHTLTP
ncbi:MAG: sodium:glutamate symporter, partial [Pirellulales bacterium]|nr:sodium:glutamate symporter [Pirellulales bacterium]